MPQLSHASWNEDAIHDLTYHRLLLSFKESVVQQAYLEDRARRYRPVRNKVHAGVCAYLALFAGHAACVHEFQSLFVVFAIFFAAANAGICCVSFCTNYFVSHSRLSQLSRFIALTMLACNILWVASGRQQQEENLVFVVSSPVILTLFNITSRTPYLHNLACLVAMSTISTVGAALRESQILVVLEVVVTLALLAVIAYEVEHVSLQDYTTMQTMDTLIRRPSDLGTRAGRGESVLEAHTVQATFKL